MGERIRRMKAKEVEAILRRYGFQLISQRGSHRKWRHPESGRLAIVPDHGGRDLPLGTIRNIFINSEIPDNDWKD